jgi:hypothetical protein
MIDGKTGAEPPLSHVGLRRPLVLEQHALCAADVATVDPQRPARPRSASTEGLIDQGTVFVPAELTVACRRLQARAVRPIDGGDGAPMGDESTAARGVRIASSAGIPKRFAVRLILPALTLPLALIVVRHGIPSRIPDHAGMHDSLSRPSSHRDRGIVDDDAD